MKSQSETNKCNYCTKKEGASFMCNSSSEEGFGCTRRKNHIGPHVACGYNEHKIRMWNKRNEGIGHQPNSKLRDPK